MARETILIVDDSPEMRYFLRASLGAAEYQTVTVDKGEAVLPTVKELHPHLILLDINLPGISGLDVLRALREEHHTVPVIMITSHAEPATILEAFRLGARDYLQKPFTIDEILRTLDQVLAEARWEEEREQMAAALAKANRELQERIQAWEALDKVGRAITATLDEKDAQRRLMEGINQVMRVEAGSLFLLDEQTGELVSKVSLRGTVEKNREIRLSPGQGVAGWALQHKKSVLVTRAYEDERFFPDADQRHTGFFTRSILAVPLTVHGKAVGVIEVLNPVGGKEYFDSSDLQILETLASSVAVAVENARLYERMRTSVTIETLRKTVTTLSHHINNSLTVIIMLANFLKEKGENLPEEIRPPWLNKSANVLRQEINRIVQVLNVLNQATTIQEADYPGNTKMIDIDEELTTRLARMTTSFSSVRGRRQEATSK